jgi:hypothetical protein
MSEVAFCETLSVPVDTFKYEVLEHANGNATAIRFVLDTEYYNPGDVLVVLDGEDIVFHGIIGGFDQGHGIATDPKGSLLPATTVQ